MQETKVHQMTQEVISNASHVVHLVYSVSCTQNRLYKSRLHDAYLLPSTMADPKWQDQLIAVGWLEHDECLNGRASECLIAAQSE